MFYGMAVVRQFEMMGVYSMNSSQSIGASRDKLFAHQLLARQGIGMPVTGFAHSVDDTGHLLKSVGGTPLIIKLLEGTQGTGLSLHHGDYPHVTTRDTTVSGCLADAGIAPSNVRKVIMVCRTYPIRVGGPSGPMAHEVDMAEIHRRSGIPLEELEKTERTTTTDRARRIAEFDWLQFRDSVQLNGPTDIALTFVDYFDVNNRKAFRFEQLSDDTISFVEEIERIPGRPVSLLSTDFNWRNVIDRRAW